MERNRIIVIAKGLCRFMQIFLILFALLFTGVLIHWHFSPESYALVVLPGAREGLGLGLDFRIISVSDAESPNNGVLLSQLSVGMLYWLYLRTLLLLSLTFLIFRSVLQILGSIESLKTFRQDNIVAFQKIGKYTLGIFVLTSFNIWIVPGDSNLNLTLAFGPLLIAVFALVMAEVFKEGNRLMEDSNLTI
jgi:hypothetical protein